VAMYTPQESQRHKMNALRSLNIKSYMITISFFFAVILFASHGNAFNDMMHYNSDLIVTLIYLILGYGLTHFITTQSNRDIRLWDIMFSFLYFFSAFAFFSDGYAAGWSHSEALFDKLFMALLLMFLFTISVFIPLLFLIIAYAHNKCISRSSSK